jgi:hypothetical protein
MAVKVGINGFGRIGRNVLRAALGNKEIDFVAVNDLTSPATLAHLLKYDSILGNLPNEIKVEGDFISVDGKKIKVTSERDPAKLDWASVGAQVVVESTGFFTDGAKAKAHLGATVKKVIISAPATNEDITIVLGVNEDKYDAAKHNIISNASCTTNCLAPVVKVILETTGLVSGIMTTIHSYTNDQVILDFPHKDLRRARRIEHDSQLHRRRQGSQAGDSGDGRQARRLRHPRAYTERVNRRPDVHRREAHDRRRRECRLQGRLRGKTEGDPGRRLEPARKLRLQGLPIELYRRCAADQGRGPEREGAELVRQRVGLLEPRGRFDWVPGKEGAVTYSEASR